MSSFSMLVAGGVVALCHYCPVYRIRSISAASISALFLFFSGRVSAAKAHTHVKEKEGGKTDGRKKKERKR